MRADAARADRRREVRLAARGWLRAGAIDESTLAAIDARYADDRHRLGPMFRTLAFLLGLLALNFFFLLIGLLSGGQRGFATACLFFSVVLAAATELLTGPLKRADSGIETASALLCIVYAGVGLALTLERGLPDRLAIGLVLLAVAALSVVGSWRWGSPLLAAVGTVFLFIFLARLPAGRALWLLVAAVAAPVLLRASEDARLPPVHRRSCLVALVLAIGAFYVAVHVGSWDQRWLEVIADFGPSPAPGAPWLRPLSVLATAAVPLALIAFAVATRRGVLLNLAILLGVASLGTIRMYFHVAPAWVVLTGSGLAALLAVLLLRRFLASGKGGERAGFTAEPLYEDAERRRLGEVVAAMASFTPAPQTAPAADGLKAGGGRYGGGGATSDF